MKKIVLVLLVIISSNLNLEAQDLLTEDQALKIAITNNPDFQVILTSLGFAKADLKQAGILENPTIFGDFAFYNLQDSFHPSAGIQKNITDIILRPLKVKIAKNKLKQTQEEIEFAMTNLIFGLRASYYNFVAAKQSLDLSQKLLLAAEIESEFAIEQNKVNNINKQDLLSHQANLTRVQKELIEVEKNYKLAKIGLIRFLGIEAEDFDYDEKLSLSDLPSTEIAEADLEGLAFTNRADLLAQKEELKAIERSVKLAKRSVLPPIRIGAEFHNEPDGTAWAPIIQTELPLFNRNQAEKQRSSVLLEQNQRKLEAKSLDIKTQVKMAYVNLVSHRDIAESYSKLLIKQNSEQLDFAKLKYNYMLADIYDLLKAKTSTLEAEISNVQALQNYWLSKAELERTIGLGLLGEDNEIQQSY